MTKFEVVLIATPAFGTFVPIVEFAQRLIDHDPRFSATILIITMPEQPLLDTCIQSRVATSAPNIKFVHLPTVDHPSPDQSQIFVAHVSSLVEKQKPNVRQAITNLMGTELDSDSDSESNSVPQLAGLFVDMFCTSIIDVAKELGIPCYLYFASPASFLSFMLHLPILNTQLTTTELAELDTELVIPGFVNPVPPSVLPPLALKGDGLSCLLYHGRRYLETKGIIINTLQELEPHSLNSFSTSQMPRVYPIGPVLDLAGPAQWHPDQGHHQNILNWLDDQPLSSVVFLCFGSMGSFDVQQVREIAHGLERAGVRFLWSLREKPKALLNLPNDYTSLEEVLPNGFLERTVGIGLVCGWVSQVSILAHKAIGGFVSHCGWNSILESLWHAVPIATWPIYAEQQMNAFMMVKELGLAMEIRLDYKMGSKMVLAEEIEEGIKSLMDGDSEVRKKVKEMSQKAKMAVRDNGSSCTSLGTLIGELANGV